MGGGDFFGLMGFSRRSAGAETLAILAIDFYSRRLY